MYTTNSTTSRRLSAALATVLLALTSLSVSAQTLPTEFSATYIAKARGFTLGRAELNLQQDGGGDYHYTSRMRATGAIGLIYRNRINETSTGAVGPDGVLPRTYDYQRTGSGGREDSVRFDQEAGVAVLHYKGQTEQRRIGERSFDPLSLHLALMHDVANGAKEMRYIVTEPRRLKAYRLEVTARERISSGHGEFDVLRVDVVGDVTIEDDADFDLADAEIPPRDDGDQTTFWFAPELDYLPVRIRHVDADDGAVELELEEISSLTR